MVFEKIKEILAEQLDIENAESITMDSLLVEDLGADSLDSIDIVMSVEDEFKLEVPDKHRRQEPRRRSRFPVRNMSS